MIVDRGNLSLGRQNSANICGKALDAITYTSSSPATTLTLAVSAGLGSTMNATRIADDDATSPPEYTDDPVTEISEVSTPVTFSADASPLLSEQPLPSDPTTATQKKKKKKKSKKSAKAKEAAAAAASKSRSQDVDGDSEDRPQVLCISRNKHWRYISSYHVRVMHQSHCCPSLNIS